MEGMTGVLALRVEMIKASCGWGWKCMWKKSSYGLEEEDEGVGMRVLARSMV